MLNVWGNNGMNLKLSDAGSWKDVLFHRDDASVIAIATIQECGLKSCSTDLLLLIWLHHFDSNDASSKPRFGQPSEGLLWDGDKHQSKAYQCRSRLCWKQFISISDHTNHPSYLAEMGLISLSSIRLLYASGIWCVLYSKQIMVHTLLLCLMLYR